MRCILADSETSEAHIAFFSGAGAFFGWCRKRGLILDRPHDGARENPDHDDLWRKDRGGRTVLHLAAGNADQGDANAEVVRFLCRGRQADLFGARDRMGLSVMDHRCLVLSGREASSFDPADPLFQERKLLGHSEDKDWWKRAVKVEMGEYNNVFYPEVFRSNFRFAGEEVDQQVTGKGRFNFKQACFRSRN